MATTTFVTGHFVKQSCFWQPWAESRSRSFTFIFLGDRKSFQPYVMLSFLRLRLYRTAIPGWFRLWLAKFILVDGEKRRKNLALQSYKQAFLMEHRERKSCSRRQTKVEYICTAVVVIALKKASGLEHNNKIVYSSSLGENGISTTMYFR